MSRELQDYEKGLRASEQLRQEALTKKGMYEGQLKDIDSDLVALGTTAEKGKQDVEAIDTQIEEKKKSLDEMIPFDLLQKWGLLK